MHPQLGERLPQLILWSTELRLGLGYIPASVEHSQGCTSYLSWHSCCHTSQRKSLGSVFLKRQMLKVLTPLWMKEHPTSTTHRGRISVLLTLCNTDHKQVLGLSAVQQLEERTHLVNHQNVNLDRKPEFNSGHGFYNEFIRGKKPK